MGERTGAKSLLLALLLLVLPRLLRKKPALASRLPAETTARLRKLRLASSSADVSEPSALPTEPKKLSGDAGRGLVATLALAVRSRSVLWPGVGDGFDAMCARCLEPGYSWRSMACGNKKAFVSSRHS